MVAVPQHLRPAMDEGYGHGDYDSASNDDGEEHMQEDTMMDDEGVMVTSPPVYTMPGQKAAALLASLTADQQRDLFAALGSAQRRNIAQAALRSLSTSTLAELFAANRYRLHIDPATRLPYELSELILQELSPLDAIRCSSLSKQWRLMSLDSQLWKLLYLREGWRVDLDALNELSRPDSQTRKHAKSVDATSSRKRVREQLGAASVTANNGDAASWNPQHDAIEADDDQPMAGTDMPTPGAWTPSEPGAPLSPSTLPEYTPASQDGLPLNEETLRAHDRPAQLEPPLKPRPFIEDGPVRSLNWHWLYKQRRKLEWNWDHGRYQTFQLPKREFLHEAHTECVYAIQFSGDWLVSGSRDQSIKIWSLITQRCVRTLTGQHTQSVLCLQFDPKADIIVSGGSDSLVVIWKFSTGEVIKVMDEAHNESVLNVRFDDRYLITCSKDMSIKIWNRHAVMSDDPIIPRVSLDRFQQNPPTLLEPYTLIGTMQGHGAAVNAIQIHEDTIVSVSGDRTIRIWNIQTGQCLKTIDGHIKGIACVQYDGRRVVSGSSDHTVRIFDAATQGEVACLQGHRNLVRTVQARFGDSSVTDEEMEVLARETQARRAKSLEDWGRRRDSDTTPRPEEPRALHTKIPIGGGGSPWARIVSGSYDERVIIWKKDSEGKWIINHRLGQEEILNGQRPRRGHRPPLPGFPGAPPMQQQQVFDPAALPHALPLHAPRGTQLRPPRPREGQHHQEEGNHHRIFKVQFDARRIVCCSQNKVIVGWDFANGDEELIQASGFFAETD